MGSDHRMAQKHKRDEEEEGMGENSVGNGIKRLRLDYGLSSQQGPLPVQIPVQSLSNHHLYQHNILPNVEVYWTEEQRLHAMNVLLGNLHAQRVARKELQQHSHH
jgi:hypothetical protein